MTSFKRWLQAQLCYLDKLANEPFLDGPDYADIGQIVSEAARKASANGLPQWSKYADVEQLRPQRAREILAEMIGATEKGRSVDPIDADTPMTVAQAAERFNLGKRTIYRLVETGQINAIRVGRAIRIQPTALEAYLAQGPRAGLFG